VAQLAKERIRRTSDLQLPRGRIWKGRQDFVLDGRLEGKIETFIVRFDVANGQIRAFLGEDGESPRERPTRIYHGQITAGRKPIMVWRRDDVDGYAAVNTLYLTSPGHFRGTWVDNFGNSGDNELEFLDGGTPGDEQPGGSSARAFETAIPGLAAHYPLDGDAKDTSGNGNHGVEHGGIAYGPGRYHLAAKLDGVDDFIEIPNSDLLNSESTVAFWVKLNENGNYSFVSKAVVGNGYGIWLGRDTNFEQGASGSGLVSFGFDGKGVQWNWRMITADTPLRPNTWHHIAAVLGESGQRLYIDGKETAFNPSVEKPSIDRPIWLGKEMRIGGGFLNSLLDEVRIYGRGLSGDEVRRLYGGVQ
jgi:hypothetical protein